MITQLSVFIIVEITDFRSSIYESKQICLPVYDLILNFGLSIHFKDLWLPKPNNIPILTQVVGMANESCVKQKITSAIQVNTPAT